MIGIPYPQKEFAKEISRHISKEHLSKNALLIDVPCGNGETAYNLSKNKNISVVGYDISEQSIVYARKKHIRKNLRFDCSDILDVLDKQKKVDFFCMINSFFLLPNRDKILNGIYQVLNNNGLVCFIIPNVNSVNYLNFIKNQPSVNLVEFTCDSFIDYVLSYGFKWTFTKPICYANLYGRKELKYFSIAAPLYLSGLNYIMDWFKIGTPSYYLIIFEKSEK